MIVAGCDVGSLTAKAVIMKDYKVISSTVMRATPIPRVSAEQVLSQACRNAGLLTENIGYVVGTGYGREQIELADSVESEIACHARGAWFLNPDVRTLVDIGGQDAKAIKIDSQGNVSRFVYNDKCASGTGRFLEVMAQALEIELEDMGDISEKAFEKVKISSQCVIFAETEVVSLVNAGVDQANIVNGLHRAMANRAASLARSIGIEKQVAFTGGVAKNKGVVTALQNAIGVDLLMLDSDPQVNGALGAALLASQLCFQQKAS